MKTTRAEKEIPLTEEQKRELERRIALDKAGLVKSYTVEEAFVIIENHVKKRK